MALIDHIRQTFYVSHQKQWYNTYWAFDLHGTIIRPSHDLSNETMDFYPYAFETLKMLSERDDIVLILFTSSYPHEIEKYLKFFENNDIHFSFVNENPDISSNMGNFGFYEKKFYFDVLFENKCGFDPNNEWEGIYNYLKWCKEEKYLPDPNWTTKY